MPKVALILSMLKLLFKAARSGRRRTAVPIAPTGQAERGIERPFSEQPQGERKLQKRSKKENGQNDIGHDHAQQYAGRHPDTLERPKEARIGQAEEGQGDAGQKPRQRNPSARQDREKRYARKDPAQEKSEIPEVFFAAFYRPKFVGQIHGFNPVGILSSSRNRCPEASAGSCRADTCPGPDGPCPCA